MALALRDDFDAARLKRCARASGNADQVRRLLALAAIYDGASRAEAAEIGGVTRQIVRDWVVRFNAGGPEALVTRKAPGKASLLTPAQRQALAQAVEDGPVPAIEVWCAGGWLTWCSGCGSGSRSASRARHWGASCGRCGIASCRPVRATTRRRRAR